MPDRKFVITETLDGSDSEPEPNVSDSALKVVLTTLYVDVKEPARLLSRPDVCAPESLLSLKLKTVCFCSSSLRVPRSALRVSVSGRDRIRTCDPALIKRML